MLVQVLLLSCVMATAKSGALPTLTLTSLEAAPLLSNNATPGAAGILYGFEGGAAWRDERCGGGFRLSVTEMTGEPHWVNTTMALWSSPDGLSWERSATLGRGSGNTNGTDWRSHLDAPMLVFNESSGRYEMFYVAYWHGVPGCAITSCNASLWRAVARARGCAGLAGPYDDAGGGPFMTWTPPSAQAWEGNQGDDSFSPPVPARGGGGWLAAYGSSRATAGGGRVWDAGMATAPSLAGPWARAPPANGSTGGGGVNPISGAIGGSVENPLIYALPAGLAPPWAFVMVYDGLGGVEAAGAVGYTFSEDGLHWAPRQLLGLRPPPPAPAPWFASTRTPQGLVPTNRQPGEFFLYFTAQPRGPGGAVPGPNGTSFPYYAVGRATVQLTAHASVAH
jgi:hypothetical protein